MINKFLSQKFLTLTEIILVLGFLVLGSWPNITSASSSSSQEVTVSAFVDSDVSAALSTIATSAEQLTSDGKSYCTVTVTVVDKDGKPLENKKVLLKSNRGLIDTIMATKTFPGNGVDTDKTYTAESYTDIDGKAYFKIKSDTAGRATFSAFVDNAVTLKDTASLAFKRPSAPTPITITTKVPSFFGIPEKTITLFKSEEEKNSDPQKENLLVERGVNFQIPFGLFLGICLILILVPVLIAIVILQGIAYGRKNNQVLKEEKTVVKKSEELIEKINNKNLG